MNTNWSSPNTNFFAALLTLRGALAAGYNAELVQMWNEECAYPIKKKPKPEEQDFRTYKFSVGYMSTYNDILNKKSPWDKHMTLNYISCFGTQEAVDKYYKTGELSMDNFKGMGKNHLVKVDDMIAILQKQPAKDTWSHERATKLHVQYRDPDTRNTSFWFDFFSKENGNEWDIVKFDHKLWVVNLLDKSQPRAVTPIGLRILNILIEPLMFIMKFKPKKYVLDMKEYKCINYRIGGVTNGFSVEFHVPKKFNFK